MGTKLAICLIAILIVRIVAADEPPVIPVGLDAYRMWDRWPQQRIGQRTYMRSTYDRRGGNEGADASHFLYQLRDDFNVTLDLEGSGLLCFVRYNHWHGSPWHYVVDGSDHVISETSTADPLHPAKDAVFEPHALFPRPLAWTWADTRGADLSWVPIGFEHSFQMAYSRTHYGTGYYIYEQFVPGAKLSQPIRAWDGKTPPDKDVLDLLDKSGTDLIAGMDLPSSRGLLHIGANMSGQLVAPTGPSVIRSIELRAPKDSATDLARVHLRIWWDGREQPSVDAPLPLFFGAGTLYNRDHREQLVRAFPVSVRESDSQVALTCYFPMPFFHSARIEFANAGEKSIELSYRVQYQPCTDPPNHVGYFHATYRDHPHPQLGADLVLLDTREVEGAGDWSGAFIGTSLIFSHNANLSTLEGDPRFYFDDSLTPQAQGTGTEEWAGGGDYWGGQNMTLPLAGHPCGAKSAKEAENDLDKIESAYRFLLADVMPFGKNARITLEHGGTDESVEHYETIAYWYGLPAPALVQTDELSIGDEQSEKRHQYSSPQASAPYELISRYEWGVDRLKDQEIFPATTDRGRTTTGVSEFTLRLRPDNLGVMLRRKLDYQYPDQRAEVSVAAVDDNGQVSADWKPAGIWYLSGSNTCVYSNPRGELGGSQHVVETSNRRFRDDEFLIGRDLTAGKDSIRVRVKFTPVRIPLYPGAKIAEVAWSEMRYTGWCFVMPRFGLE